MGCLGVHYSLSEEEVQRLCEIEDQVERANYVHEVIEEEYFTNQKHRTGESDKAWDAIHRAFSDGELTFDGGEYPLNHVILGGEQIYFQPEYIMILKTPTEVRDVAAELRDLSEEDFRNRYFQINPDSYRFAIDEEDLAYTWYWFQRVREFWMLAASEGRCVLFTADQ